LHFHFRTRPRFDTRDSIVVHGSAASHFLVEILKSQFRVNLHHK
jgi:hypothetical protein